MNYSRHIVSNQMGDFISMQQFNLFLSSFSYLVEQKEIDVNVRDKWDSTPL